MLDTVWLLVIIGFLLLFSEVFLVVGFKIALHLVGKHSITGAMTPVLLTMVILKIGLFFFWTSWP
jgi:hypothetical protein